MRCSWWIQRSLALLLLAGPSTCSGPGFVEETVGESLVSTPAADEPRINTAAREADVLAHFRDYIATNGDGVLNGTSEQLQRRTRLSPSLLHLVPTTDTGTSDTDDRTNNPTPILAGTSQPSTETVILVNGHAVGAAISLSDGTFTYQLPPLSGTNTITAITPTWIATPITVIVDPFLSIHLYDYSDDGNPGDLITTQRVLSFYGYGPVSSAVTISDDGVDSGTTSTDASGFWQYSFLTTTGKHTFQIADPANFYSDDIPQEVTVTIVDKPLAPVLLGLSAATNTGVQGDGMTADPAPAITGTASPNAQVVLVIDDDASESGGADGSGAFSIAFNSLSPGPHTIVGYQTTTDGFHSDPSSNLDIVILLEKPMLLQITTGTDTGTLGDLLTSNQNPVLVGSGITNAQILLLENGAQVASGIIDNTGSFLLTVPTLPGPGQYTFVTQQVVGGLNSELSDPLIVNIVPPPPVLLDITIALDTGVQGDKETTDTTSVIIGTALPTASLVLFLGSVQIGLGSADDSGGFTITTSVLGPPGQYVITARQSILAFESELSEPFTITILPEAPVLNDVNPSPGTNENNVLLASSRTPIIGGLALPNTNIVLSEGTRIAGSGQTDNNGILAITTNTQLSLGLHTFTAVAWTSEGLMSLKSLPFSIEVVGPGSSSSSIMTMPSSTTESSSSTAEVLSSTMEIPNTTWESSSTSSAVEIPSTTAEIATSIGEGLSSETGESPSTTAEIATATGENHSSATGESPSTTAEIATSIAENPSTTTEILNSSINSLSFSTMETLSTTADIATSTGENHSSVIGESPSPTAEIATSIAENPSTTAEILSSSTNSLSFSTMETLSTTAEIATSTGENHSSAIGESPSTTAEIATSIAESPSTTAEIATSIAESPSTTAEIATSIGESPSTTAEIATSTAESPSTTAEILSSSTDSLSFSIMGTLSITAEISTSTPESFSSSTGEGPSFTVELLSATVESSSSMTETPSTTVEILTLPAESIIYSTVEVSLAQETTAGPSDALASSLAIRSGSAALSLDITSSAPMSKTLTVVQVIAEPSVSPALPPLPASGSPSVMPFPFSNTTMTSSSRSFSTTPEALPLSTDIGTSLSAVVSVSPTAMIASLPTTTSPSTPSSTAGVPFFLAVSISAGRRKRQTLGQTYLSLVNNQLVAGQSCVKQPPSALVINNGRLLSISGSAVTVASSVLASPGYSPLLFSSTPAVSDIQSTFAFGLISQNLTWSNAAFLSSNVQFCLLGNVLQASYTVLAASIPNCVPVTLFPSADVCSAASASGLSTLPDGATSGALLSPSISTTQNIAAGPAATATAGVTIGIEITIKITITYITIEVNGVLVTTTTSGYQTYTSPLIAVPSVCIHTSIVNGVTEYVTTTVACGVCQYKNAVPGEITVYQVVTADPSCTITAYPVVETIKPCAIGQAIVPDTASGQSGKTPANVPGVSDKQNPVPAAANGGPAAQTQAVSPLQSDNNAPLGVNSGPVVALGSGVNLATHPGATAVSHGEASPPVSNTVLTSVPGVGDATKPDAPVIYTGRASSFGPSLVFGAVAALVVLNWLQ